MRAVQSRRATRNTIYSLRTRAGTSKERVPRKQAPPRKTEGEGYAARAVPVAEPKATRTGTLVFHKNVRPTRRINPLGKLQTLLTRKQRQQKAEAELSAVAWVLRYQLVPQFGSLETSSTRWLELLNDHATDHLKQSCAWPTTANQLGQLFSALSEGLELLGVVLSFRRSNGVRLWRCETAEIAAKRRHCAANRVNLEEMRRTQRAADQQLLKQIQAQRRVLDQQRGRKTN